MHNLGPELEPLLAYFSQIESQLKGSIFVSNIVSNAAVTKHRQKRQCDSAEAPPETTMRRCRSTAALRINELFSYTNY